MEVSFGTSLYVAFERLFERTTHEESIFKVSPSPVSMFWFVVNINGSFVIISLVVPIL